MNPLLIVPVALGVGWMFSKVLGGSKKKSSSGSSSSGSTTTTAGYTIENCARMLVTDGNALRAQVETMIAAAPSAATVDSLTKGFFASSCVGVRFPSTQAQITMYAFVASGFVGLLFAAGRLTPAASQNEFNRIVEMLRAAKVTPQTWSAVFGGTVPLDDRLASALKG